MDEIGHNALRDDLFERFDRIARFYDYDYRDYDDDLDLIVELAEQCDGPVLELGCGTGRVLQPVLEAGLRVTGIDGSRALLERAAKRLSQAGVNHRASLVQANLRDFSLDRVDFAFAFCTSNTFMHLDSAEAQLDALFNTHSHLRDGGLLLIDLFNPDIPRLLQVDGVMECADQWRQDESEVIKWIVRRLDIAEQLQDTLFVYEEIGPDGVSRRTLFPFTLRFLWHNEARLMLEKAGFSVEAVWGDFDGQPYGGDSDRLILLARKRLALD